MCGLVQHLLRDFNTFCVNKATDNNCNLITYTYNTILALISRLVRNCSSKQFWVTTEHAQF